MRQLALFARHWQPGEAKTRLGRSIGSRRAALLHRAFLETLLARFAALPVERVLAFTPHDRREAFAALPAVAQGDWRLVGQAAGDLGERMAAQLDTAFAAGVHSAVVIGADSPNLPLELVERAFDQLGRSSVVLGPCDDGGYYLLGARGAVPPVFDGMAWGSGSVFAQTLERLERGGIDYGLLPPWYDVDEARDLERLRGDLHGTGRHSGKRGHNRDGYATDAHLAALALRIEAIVAEGGEE